MRGSDGLPQMTPAALRLACLEHDGYEGPALNDKLYLHFKGYRKICNLEPYVNLKTLFLESNGLQSISGMDHLSQMRSLYLQQNVISKIENLDSMHDLKTLNLSQNRITKVENLSGLTSLETLNLAKNAISGSEALEGLLECPSITNLDLSSNELEDATVIDTVITRLPRLSCLYLKGNPLVRKTKHYRKTLITKLPRLAYLDDRPVFELERIAAEAWATGGKEAEKAARQEFKNKKDNEDRGTRARFKKWKAERKAAREAEIAKCKAEGRPLPQPRCFVRYAKVTDEERDAEEKERRALRIREATAEAGKGPAGTIAALGREFAKECGARFDDEGNLIEGEGNKEGGEKKEDDNEHHMVPGWDASEREHAKNEAADRKVKASKAHVSAGTVRETQQSSALSAGVSTQRNSEEGAAMNSHTNLAKEVAEVITRTDENNKNSSNEDDELDGERRKAVEDSMRLYRQRRKGKGSVEKTSKSGDDEMSGSLSKAMPASLSSAKPDAMQILLDTEMAGLTPSQRAVMEDRVAEAEEEEENYRSSRAAMKARASKAAVTRSKMGANVRGARVSSAKGRNANTGYARGSRSQSSSKASLSPEWSKSIDAQLQQLVRENLFDFAAVATAMRKNSTAQPESAAAFYTTDTCRLRFALLASGKKPTYKSNQQSNANVPAAPATNTRPMVPPPSTSVRSYEPVHSTYVPWNQRNVSDSSVIPSIAVPPSSTEDENFNSKVMRIKPVTVDLSALPSMLSSDEDASDADDDIRGDTKVSESTDVDGLD